MLQSICINYSALVLEVEGFGVHSIFNMYA